MKVLHLLSDWKWTGPAEPAVSLCEALNDEGLDVTIAYRKTPIPFPERTVGKEVAARHIPYHEGFRLNRYFSLTDWLYDIKAIGAYVREKNIDIVHAHLSHDHITAVFAFFAGSGRPVLIRSDHKRDGLPRDRFTRWALKRTDGLVAYSKGILEGDIRALGFPREKTCVIPPGVKPYTGPVKNIREEFGIGPDEKIVGVIGRLKPDRGYDTILHAFKEVREHVRNAKLIVVGRSSQIEKSIMEPIKNLGIERDVILAGYRIEDYFSVISIFDLFVMMRAGSDGSARALREVLAMGKPAVVSNAGILPELVEDGVTGYVVHQNPEELAARMESILLDDEKRRKFGNNARGIAADKWSYKQQAGLLIDFYENLLTSAKR